MQRRAAVQIPRVHLQAFAEYVDENGRRAADRRDVQRGALHRIRRSQIAAGFVERREQNREIQLEFFGVGHVVLRVGFDFTNGSSA